MLTITLPDNTTRLIRINKMDALDGWDMQEAYTNFVMSTDKVFRRRFTIAVLKYASVIIGENELPLETDALINNHLAVWPNIKLVFEEVLNQNSINPDTHAEKPHYWQNAGAEMAVSFIAETSKLILPMMAAVEAQK